MTSTVASAERARPGRGAAQKASENFAEQLTDSPGRSDGDSPTSNPFLEPTHRTKSIKYRYSATGKHLSSPLKGSSSSPETTVTKSKRAKLSFILTPPLRADKPAVATTSRKRKASSSLCKEDSCSPSLSPLSSAPTSPTLSIADLPPIPDPQKRTTISKTASLHSLEPHKSIFSTFSQPLSPNRKQKKTKAEAKQEVSAWNIGNSVWVFVNQSGVLVDNASQPPVDPGLSDTSMWWPAQVVQKQPLRVSLFGDFPSSSSTSKGLCTIFAPSPSNVQSINDDNGAKRFSRATFRPTLVSAGNASPPTKKQRLDESASIQDKWEAAVQSMEKASTLEKDGLPALLSSYATTGGNFDDSDPDASDLRHSVLKSVASVPKRLKVTGSSRKLKSQRSRANLQDDVTASTTRDLSPCPADPTLQIPGELILAMAPKTGVSYWPAQILEHIPARNEKYKVKFLDDEEYVITRDRFWTSEEEGFVRCTLGEWESAIKTVEDPESEDEVGDDDPNTRDSCDATSALPTPPRPEDFEDLSARAQLAYVKPVLRAILNKEYAPAMNKHEAFMKGGSGRAALLKSAGVRGGMDARFVRRVQKAICEWVLGDRGVRPQSLVIEDVMTGPGEKEEQPAIKAAEVETLPHDEGEGGKMTGIEEGFVSADGHANMNDSAKNEALAQPAPEKQTEVARGFEMAIDGQDQQTAPLSLLANGAVLSPVVQQASLAPKSQLDLLAEVSQAVATEPSLLPSHPELPKLKIDPPDVPNQDSPQLSPLTPVPDEDQPVLCWRDVLVLSEEFESLSAVDKLDYCLNILLPESIQQLLLWRSGERTSAPLLSPEEEQRLHDVSVRKAVETDWVDDVMRLRAAQARLWGIDPSKMAEAREEVIQGGTRSRPRRGTVSRP